MGKMSYIHYLCEKENLKELIEEVGSEVIAKQFIDAHRIMRENRDTVAFKNLNKIADEGIQEYNDNPDGVKKEGQDARVELSNMFNDVVRPN
jgi:hypothetical protein